MFLNRFWNLLYSPILPFLICATSFTFSQAALLQEASQKQVEPQAPRYHTIVLGYADFGPQAAAYKLIGYEWYQWNKVVCGCDDPNKRDDVKVVVYRSISIKKVKAKYPVVTEVSDYRYIEYSRALRYLERQIEFWEKEMKSDPDLPEMFDEMIALYKSTHARIIEALGM